MTRIADLIEVPPVKTVIQMADIEDPDLRSFLTESFLLTDEVRQVLESFFNSIIKQQGKGFFLEGNYGSGKSHLLTVISLLLSYQESWQSLLTQQNVSDLLIEQKNELTAQHYLVVNISLVEHSSSERLEEIINNEIINTIRQKTPGNLPIDSIKKIDASKENRIKKDKQNIDYADFANTGLANVDINIKTLKFTVEENYKRKEFYGQLAQFLSKFHYQGIVILIDELSEFLRSKADGRTFNEDIRFLQYLGEFSERENFWIMATLQEAIEKTGEITQEVFGKIKDRFPAHFHLTGTHIQEIVSQRLIRIKPGTSEEIIRIYKHYQDSFAEWPVSKERFLKLYPVNPLTISLLDKLKPLFSQHRGIIDFIHYRLQGDTSRNIPSMLEESTENLLNPDLIFDHFLNRLRETMETRQYYEKVYQYYEQEVDSILSEDEVETGLKLIKILILLAVSPIDKKYTVREISHMLLRSVTDLDASVNYEYIDELLQRLYRHGAYLVTEQGDSTRDNIYYLDLKADVNLIIGQKTEYIRSNFFEEEQRIFTKVGSLINESYLPLVELLDKPRSIRTVYWQNTERQGYFLLLPMTDITLKGVAEFNKRLGNMEIDDFNKGDFRDFVIFMAYPLQVDKQKKYIKEIIIPEIHSQERASFCFWIPEELSGLELLKNVLSRIILLEEYQEKSGETATAVREKLEAMLQEDRKNVTDLFREAFLDGIILDGNGEEILSLDDIGIVPFNKLLERITGILLENRYPEHVKIAPYQSVINEGQLNRLAENFLDTGEIDRKVATSQGLLRIIEDVLNPLGLIKSRGKTIRVNINPGKNPLLKEFFTCLHDERTDINTIYRELRKGNYGLTLPQFKILVLVLLYSGYITSFSEKQKIALSQLNVYNFSRIKYLGYGEIIADDFQKILKECSLLPPRFKEQPFSLPLQQDIWAYISEMKREMMDEITHLKIKLTNLTLDGSLESINHQQLINNIDKVKNLFEEIKISYSAEEGLERFASSYVSIPNIDNYLQRFHLIKSFLDQGYQKLKEMQAYLKQVPEDLPDRGNFPEIRSIKAELLESIQDHAVIFNEGFLEGLLDRFEFLKELYIEEYYREHQKNLSGDRFSLYNNVEKNKDYQVLNRLADIELISVKDDLIKVQRMLSRILRQECTKLSRGYLQRSPICTCGYFPGEEIDSISLEEIHSIIGSGIGQYLEALNSKEYREKIEKYISNMEAVGEKRFARPVRELLDIASLEIPSINSDIIEKLYQLLNRNILNRINQALSGSITLHERNLDHLYENLVGRSFSIAQIKQIFDDWLERDQSFDRYSYVKVISEENSTVPKFDEDNNLIEGFLEEYYPELLAYYDQLGEEGFSIFIATVFWADQYKIKRTDLYNIIEWPVELYDEINTETVYQLWDRVSEDKYQAIRKRVTENLNRQIENNHLIEQLFKVIPLADFEDMIKVLEKEFVSYQLIRELIVVMIKRTEKGLSEKILTVYLERLNNVLLTIKDNERAVYLKMVKSYLQLRHSLYILEGEEKPSSAEEWSDFYRKHLSHLEYNLAAIRKAARKHGLLDRIPFNKLAASVEKVMGEYMEDFYQFSKSELFRINEQATEYLQREVKYVTEIDMSELILERYHEMTSRVNSRGNCCILIDGMRQDTWEVIKEELNDSIDYRIIKEGFLYANLPSNTETQISRLKENGFRGEILSADDYLLHKKDIEENAKNNGIVREIVKFSYVDDRVHSSKEDYCEFMEEIRFQTENHLIPFLHKIPSRTLILIVSDHGYRINHKFRKEEKYESPRYLHGGNSPYEIIVPWGILYKI
ncbi:MAG: DUF6079 family protein [Halanaerobiales bacterium]